MKGYSLVCPLSPHVWTMAVCVMAVTIQCLSTTSSESLISKQQVLLSCSLEKLLQIFVSIAHKDPSLDCILKSCLPVKRDLFNTFLYRPLGSTWMGEEEIMLYS